MTSKARGPSNRPSTGHPTGQDDRTIADFGGDQKSRILSQGN